MAMIPLWMYSRLPVPTKAFRASSRIRMMRTSLGSIPAARNKGLAKVRNSVSVSASRITTRRMPPLPPNWARAGGAMAADNTPASSATPGSDMLGSDTLGSDRACPAHNRQPVIRERNMHRSLAARAGAVLLAVGFATSGCSTIDSFGEALTGPSVAAGQEGFVSGFLGAVAADEPQAALAARSVLSRGGTAADAAVAAGLTLAVTLPSRAGLGGGGACLAFAPKSPTHAPEAYMFLPQPGGGTTGGVPGGMIDRPAAVPMLARGLFAVHARYGRLPFESLVAPAEQLARFGAPVSRAFASDLAVVAGPLAADPVTADIFLPGGRVPGEGAVLMQTDLAATIGQLRSAGVGDLHQGVLARRLAESSIRAGGGITAAALRAALPTVAAPLSVPLEGGDAVAFLPPPADGGLAAAAAFRLLRANPAALDAAGARALGVATRWRQGGYGGNAEAALAADDTPPASLPPLPASTSFVTLDREGNAVACTLTMNNLFGTGRVAPQTGVLLAASPASVPAPLLAAAIVYNTNIFVFKAAMAATGQQGAPLALAAALQQSLASRRVVPNPVPEPGRVNAIFCPRYLPGSPGECAWSADPRENGLAVGSN